MEDAAVKSDVDRDAVAGADTDAVHDPVDMERGEREAMIAGPRLERGPLGAAVSGGRKVSRLEKRREKIRAEIDRNRRGDFKVPTWVLAVALVVFVAGWVALIVWA